MNRELDAFVKEGFEKYRAAREAVETFEEEVQRRIRSVLEARSDWGVLERRTIKDNGPGRDAKLGRWITASVSGSTRSGEKADIDLGVWWNAPNASYPVFVYSQFFNNPHALRAFAFAGGRGISTYRHGRDTILHSPVPEDLDFGRILNAQLDVLLEQLSQLEDAK